METSTTEPTSSIPTIEPLPEGLILDEKFRQEQRRLNASSLFYFARVTLGMSLFGPLHADLCAHLEGSHGAWRRLLVAGYRGCKKSSATTIAYVLWRILHMPSWSCLIVEHSEELAYKNHFSKIMNLISASPRAEYIQWLYSDKIPTNFRGWNQDQLAFVGENPMNPSVITYAGVRSRKEGTHVDCIVGDDLEGADAEESDVPNRLAWGAYQAFPPLLRNKRSSQILIVGTPWGDDPLVWKIRDLEKEHPEDEDGTLDNSKRTTFMVWWKTPKDENGNIHEPNEYSDEELESLKLEMGDLYDTQFELKRRGEKGRVFDMDAVRRYAWSWSPTEQRTIEYIGTDWKVEKVEGKEVVVPFEVPAKVSVDDLWCWTHVDPTHRAEEDMKSTQGADHPSLHAVVTVGVGPDFHAHVLEVWHEDGDLAALVSEACRQFRKWNSQEMTVEMVAAQAWFKDYLELREQTERTGFIHANKPELAMAQRSIVANLKESDNANKSKEWKFREGLSPWLNRGLLHLNLAQQERLVHQLDHITNTAVAIDAADALAQGPAVWRPAPNMRAISRELARRQKWVMTMKNKHSGYVPPRRQQWIHGVLGQRAV